MKYEVHVIDLRFFKSDVAEYTKEEQRRERALTYKISRSKQYK